MASPTLPWRSLWRTLWGLISTHATEGRVIVAVDDSINPKSGRKIFGCGHFHDHAAKKNQTAYPWSQCILAIGLLKKVQSRWACLPLDFRFYFMQKDIETESINAIRKGEVVTFASKMEQAAAMLKEVQVYFKKSILVVTDSWFGNDGLWKPLGKGSDGKFHLLSRMRTNITLYGFPDQSAEIVRRRGRPRKYGSRLGKKFYRVSLRKTKRGTGLLAGRYVENAEVSSTCCLGFSENTIRCTHDHRPVTLC